MTAQLDIDIKPTVVDGRFYVGIIMDGCELERRRGPFSGAAEAEAAAERLRRFSRTLARSHLSGA